MGRRHSSTNYFSPNDSNTICDTTGFKVKKSQVTERWEGFHVIAKAWHPRQPQDFPVVPVEQLVYENVRTEQVEAEGTVTGFDII